MLRPGNTRNRRVFDSVFGPGDLSQPTPIATPATFPAPGQRWGVPEQHSKNEKTTASIHQNDTFSSDDEDPLSTQHQQTTESKHVRDQVQWDRSWHITTHAFTLSPFPKSPKAASLMHSQADGLGAPFYAALEDVLASTTRLPYAGHTEDIVIWHTQQVRSHFLSQVLPVIHHLAKQHDRPDELVSESVQVLETAHVQYFRGLGYIKKQLDVSAPKTSVIVVAKFSRDLHAIVSNSVAAPLSDALRKVLVVYVSAILGLPSNEDQERVKILPESPRSERALGELLELVKSLKNVGLAGERFQIMFAEIMNNSMHEYVQKGFSGVWSSEDGQNQDGAESLLPRAAHLATRTSWCTTELCEWVENRYAKLAVQVLSNVANPTSVTWANMEKYKEWGIGHLADLRIKELFDIVINWPNGEGALDDLRTAITTPQRRLHLTEAFAKTLDEKLLHPGTSTLQILQTYICMIWSFHFLDHSKVLLDRVAYPLQLYLLSREDTVRIIITGLLADPEELSKGASSDKLVELAQLLNNSNQEIESRANYDEELDWHDMEWVPDPVDAGPGYKRSKNADVIGTLIGALGASEVFIKEFQNVIGEHLLRNDGGFEREIKVLELLKARYGDAPLQACEVMLKDIQDSSRVNSVIRRDQALDPSEDEVHVARSYPEMNLNPEGLHKPSLHAKILSRLFWPQLQDDSYKIPDEITTLQKQYEHGFETLKSARKLTWLPALGQATVELEFEDRKVFEEVHTWQATVIWAFQSEDGLEVSRTISDLVDTLEMEEPLVRSALKFWSNKLVLHENNPGTYTVLETLNTEDRARSNAQAAASVTREDNSDDTDVMASEAATNERMQVYWQFIQGMLKNSRREMPLAQIAMVLKMSIADGVQVSNEELQDFLGGKVGEGILEVKGGKYRLKK